MSRLGKRIDAWLLRTRDRQQARADSSFYLRGRLLLHLVLWLHAWHAYEVRQLRERDYEVRERNRLRGRELEGEPREVNEDAWREGGIDTRMPTKEPTGIPLKRWDFERRPGTSFGLILSRMLLLATYSFGVLCALFVAAMLLLCCLAVLITPFLRTLEKPSPQNVPPKPLPSPALPPKGNKPGDLPAKDQPRRNP